MRDEDVLRYRQQTPGVAAIAHFNNAGSALPPDVVVDTVTEYLREESLLGGYETAALAADRVDAVYASVARLLGAGAEDVALTDNATRSWQAVFYAMRFEAGDRILTCRSEYASNVIAYLQVARRTGAVVEVVDDDETGQVDVEDLARRIDGRVKLISMSHVPTQGGLVNPAERIGAVAREAGIPFLLDACQSAGQLDLDVGRLGCDALSGTGRKYLRGPRGTGFLYVHPRLRERLEPAMLDLHSAEWTEPGAYEVAPGAKRFEVWERNFGLVLGLGAAVDYALAIGLPAIEERVTALGARLRGELSAINGVTVRDQGAKQCGIVTFTTDRLPAAEVKARLGEAKINTSVTGRTSAQYDFAGRGLPDLVRASVHYYNTEDEIRLLTEELARLLS
ncbi:aminotransferase class V-fold PLP-dependent enzyme [Amycolatopsis acidiphila]|uniref:Aminotransferase class V-fold PLP-dependent enzyme n=1 Tax=Amycolatopsis acidiphila TaxID=715473 RepID=A0A557ZSM1_9PSEU|nr:aminotransferase class V-fold PLP-dependent enzyme [Amycolatopsis acidiphila]TVT15001.1 aminotransferase class V-fold PLP-dependent enzyme [Amycolatopsis acidiphila]UIJ58487.1 aminotransferase class V-fold PLP-dependent enzyme [Amycolatopsis acidiphila]GHG77226.1 aminotransferase class V [Amycolatopsis acidiphila]